MMEVSTTFLRWVARERPEMLAKFQGLQEYVETRIGARGCVASETRVARPAPESAQGRRKKPEGAGAAPKPQPAPAREVARPGADLFRLAAAMRKATE